MVNTKEWADMTAEERKEHKATQKAQATQAVENDGFPTGLKVIVGGHEFIARPVRQTGSGGVTYSIDARPTQVAGYSARFNKFSLTLMGEGTSEASFNNERIA